MTWNNGPSGCSTKRRDHGGRRSLPPAVQLDAKFVGDWARAENLRAARGRGAGVSRHYGTHSFIEEIGGTGAEGLAGAPDGQQRHILLSSLHAADMRTIDTHPLGQRLLAEAGPHAIAAQIRPEELPDVHPKDGAQSRILSLRIIIRGHQLRQVPKCLPRVRA